MTAKPKTSKTVCTYTIRINYQIHKLFCWFTHPTQSKHNSIKATERTPINGHQSMEASEREPIKMSRTGVKYRAVYAWTCEKSQSKRNRCTRRSIDWNNLCMTHSSSSAVAHVSPFSHSIIVNVFAEQYYTCVCVHRKRPVFSGDFSIFVCVQ